jgi:hypothetical protein
LPSVKLPEDEGAVKQTKSATAFSEEVKGCSVALCGNVLRDARAFPPPTAPSPAFAAPVLVATWDSTALFAFGLMFWLWRKKFVGS